MRNNPIGVFDSGVGGLNVLVACSRKCPNENFIYLADKANMPYGTKSPYDIKAAALSRCGELIARGCKAIVVACNTATATAADDMRALYGGRIIVGLEPAVKPCVRELGRRGYAVALVTEATSRTEKFKRLISDAGGNVIPLARPELAELIEENMRDISAIAPHVCDILRPYADAEAIVLGCSHYSYIADIIRDFYGEGIKIYDGAIGVAERLDYCLRLSGLCCDGNSGGKVRFFSTYEK